jgi:hypothetical protein
MLLCHFDTRSFVAADSVRILKIVSVWRYGERKGTHWIAIENPPKHLLRVGGIGRIRLGPYSKPHGWYSRPYVECGYAFEPSALGLLPGEDGRWSSYWLMRTTDL